MLARSRFTSKCWPIRGKCWPTDGRRWSTDCNCWSTLSLIDLIRPMLTRVLKPGLPMSSSPISPSLAIGGRRLGIVVSTAYLTFGQRQWPFTCDGQSWPVIGLTKGQLSANLSAASPFTAVSGWSCRCFSWLAFTELFPLRLLVVLSSACLWHEFYEKNITCSH